MGHISRDEQKDVHVEASIIVNGSKDNRAWGGGDVYLKRVRGTSLISLSAHGSSMYGGGPVQVDPAKLRDALDKLVNEDLGR